MRPFKTRVCNEMQRSIVGWDYYEDGELCRFFSVREFAALERLAARSGGTCIPRYSEEKPEAGREAYTTEPPLTRY
jgi:hypothetical protein